MAWENTAGAVRNSIIGCQKRPAHLHHIGAWNSRGPWLSYRQFSSPRRNRLPQPGAPRNCSSVVGFKERRNSGRSEDSRELTAFKFILIASSEILFDRLSPSVSDTGTPAAPHFSKSAKCLTPAHLLASSLQNLLPLRRASSSIWNHLGRFVLSRLTH